MHKSLNQFLELQKVETEARAENRALILTAIIIICILVLAVSLIVYWRKLRKKQALVEYQISQIGSMFKELDESKREIESLNHDRRQIAAEMAGVRQSAVRKTFLSKYSLLNDFYYQYSTSKEADERDKICNSFNRTVKQLTGDASTFDSMAADIDSCFDGLYSDFTNEFKGINENYRRIFIFSAIGLDTTAMSILLEKEPSQVYNLRKRVREIIAKSDSPRKEEYLACLKGAKQ